MFGSNENKNKLIEWKSKKQELRSTKPEASFPERWIKKKKDIFPARFLKTSSNPCTPRELPGPQKPCPASGTVLPFLVIRSGASHAAPASLTMRGGCSQCGVRRACRCGLGCLPVWAQGRLNVGQDGHKARRGSCQPLPLGLRGSHGF